MSGSIGVPERESGVKLSPLGFHHRVGRVTVISVYIGYHVGLNDRVVERGIEIYLLLVCARCLYAAQMIIPIGFGCLAGAFEIPCRYLGLKILPGALY